MKNSKKILAGILTLLIIANVFMLAGCNGNTCKHQWQEATCTSPKTCSLCQATEGNALGHTPNADDGDCTTAITCSVCSAVVTAAKTEHVGGVATCDHKAHCSVCKKEYGELTEHTWNYDSATEEHDKHCTVCGYVAQAKLDHTHTGKLTHVEAVAADCDTAGNIEYWTCSCGKWFSDSDAKTEIKNHDDVIISALEHSHSTEWSYDETQHWHECACGDKSDIAGHVWNYDAATVDHDKHCTLCGYVAEEQIGHTHEFEAELSYDDEGHYYAPTCEHTYVKKDYTAHSYESVVTAPTCTEQGYTTYTCMCGHTYKDNYTSADGHVFKEVLTSDNGGHWYSSSCGHDVTKGYATHSFDSVVTDPTCTEQGYTTYSCDCGYSYVGDYVSATGHSVTNWNEDASSLFDAQTCKHAVSYAGVCSVCFEPQEKIEYIEKHAWTYVVKEGSEATCKSDGLKLQYCKNENCKYHDTAKDEVPYSDPDAHAWVEDDTQNISGMTSYHCSSCDATKNTVSSSGTSANVSSGNVGSLDEVELKDAVIGFDQNIKDKLSESGSNVEISAGTLEGDDRDAAINDANLTPEQKALLGNKEIYDFTVTTTENVSELGGTATIRIPYVLSAGEDPDNVIVWYISNGELTAVPATYADGYVTFTTTHFSYYVATTITPEQLCEYLKEHDLTNVHTVPPTCTEGGYSICIRCGKQIEGSEVAPLGHEWHTTVITENNCTTNGITKYECSICKFNYETIVSATGHYYVLKDQKNATCTQSGYATHSCIYCDGEYTITLPQLSHNYVTNTVSPTCENRGYTEKTCLTCGDTLYTNYLDALGHSYDTIWHTNPNGHYHNCTVCGKSGDVTSHTPGAEATELSAQICTVCEYVITPQLSHKHSLTKVDANTVSCLENGNIAYYTCECGKWFLDADGKQLITDHSAVIVLAQGHTHKSLAYVEPTCTTVGYTAGIGCSVCDIIIRGHVELPAYEHDYVTTETAPTCSAEGTVSKVCSACGDKLADETIPKLDHKHTVSSIKAPTCTEAGFTTYVCIYCGDSYTGAQKEALGHICYEDWYTDENGHWHECTRCGEHSDEADHTPGAEATESSAQICTVCEFVIEPIRNHTHTAVKTIPETAPTCSSMGNIAYYICSCGEWYYDEACTNVISDHKNIIVAALDHDLSFVEEKTPTCTESGYSAGYYCTRCKRFISGHQILPTTEHDYVYDVCTNCGDQRETVILYSYTSKELTLILYSNAICYFSEYGYDLDMDGSLDSIEGEGDWYLSENGRIYVTINSGEYIFTATDSGELVPYVCTHENTTTTTTDATCTEYGRIITSCADCGTLISTIGTLPLGHDFVDGICTNCGASEVESDVDLSQMIDNAVINAESEWNSLFDKGVNASTIRANEMQYRVIVDNMKNADSVEILEKYQEQFDELIQRILKTVEGNVTEPEEPGESDVPGESEEPDVDLSQLIEDAVFNAENEWNSLFDRGVSASTIAMYENQYSVIVDSMRNADSVETLEKYQVQFDNLIQRILKTVEGDVTEPEDPEVPDVPVDCTHEKTYVDNMDATCTEDGYYREICAECGMIISENYTDAFGHNFADGFCTNCGESDDESDVDLSQLIEDAVFNAENEWNSLFDRGVSPSTIAMYENQYSVIVDSMRNADSVEMLEKYQVQFDNLIQRILKSVEGDVTEPEEPIDCTHEKTYVDNMDATCTEDGYYREICDECGEIVEEKYIYSLGHSFEDGVCTVCGESEVTEEKKVLYTYDSKELIFTLYSDNTSYYTELIYTADGMVNKYEGERNWDMFDGRIYVYTDNAEYVFTVAESGELIPYEEGGDVTEPEEPIDCTHEKTYVDSMDATCTEDGYYKEICAECDMIISENYTYAFGHNFEDGYCTSCGESEVVEEVGILYTYTSETLMLYLYSDYTSEYAENVYTEDGSVMTTKGKNKWYMSDGKIHAYTDNAEHVFTATDAGELIPYEEGGDVTEPEKPIDCTHEKTYIDSMDATCTEDGYYRVICDECGEIVAEKYIYSLGHSFEDGVCTVCGESEVTEEKKVLYTYDSKELIFTLYSDNTSYYTELIYTADGMVNKYEGERNWDMFDGRIYVYTDNAEYVFTVAESGELIPYEEGGDVSEPEVPVVPEDPDVPVDCTHEKTYIDSMDATCTEDGYYREICAECDMIISENYTDAFGHNFADGFCTNCGESDDESDVDLSQLIEDAVFNAENEWNSLFDKGVSASTIAMYENQYSVIVDSMRNADSVETLEKYQVQFDNLIQRILKTVEGDVTEPEEPEVPDVPVDCTHEKTYVDSMDATCTEDGYYREICAECGMIISENYTDAFGHNFADGFCTNCGESEVVEEVGILYTYTSETLMLYLYSDYTSEYAENVYTEDGSVMTTQGRNKWYMSDGKIHAYTDNAEYVFTVAESGELIPYEEGGDVSEPEVPGTEDAPDADDEAPDTEDAPDAEDKKDTE